MTRRALRVAAVAAALLVELPAAGAAAADPPPVHRLFGCPLLAEPASFAPRRGWVRTGLGPLGVSVATPGRWHVELDGARAELVSGSGRTALVVRRSRLGGANPARVKAMLEAHELGPSHAGGRCAAALAERLAAATGLDPVLVGVYGRPLAARRRSYGLFVGVGGETVSVVLTIRWDRDARRPDLEVVRRVLGSLRLREEGS